MWQDSSLKLSRAVLTVVKESETVSQSVSLICRSLYVFFSKMSESSTTPAPKERERWSSNVAFYFAAIGAAVGFGNVWRFPALAASKS